MIAPELAPLAWLIGPWEAEPDATGVAGGSLFSPAAGGRALLRSNWALYPATEGRAASRHDDILVVHSENGALRALYVDNEGHVIRYEVVAAADRVVLTSVEGVPGPRFRLTLAAIAGAALSVAFEIAPPGGDFARYVGGTLRRALG
jgi:hypothetical protein